MSKPLLHRVGEALHGSRWQSPLAADLGMSDRHMRRLASGEAELTPGMMADLRRLCQARRADLDAVEVELSAAVGIIIPDGLTFADLHLARHADGGVSYDWSVIEAICTESGIDADALRGHEDNVSALIIGWYHVQLQHGGAHDPVADELMAEVAAEDAAGQHLSYPSGRA